MTTASDIHRQDLQTIATLKVEKQSADVYYNKYSNKRVEALMPFYSACDGCEFPIVAIHANTDLNGDCYTPAELARAASSLSFRPLTINHMISKMKDFEMHLPYPACSVRQCWYDPVEEGIVGAIQLDPYRADLMLRKKAFALSVESIELDGKCEGLIFLSLSLLQDKIPADKKARIIPVMQNNTIPTSRTEKAGIELI